MANVIEPKYNQVIRNPGKLNNRVLIGTAATGLVRIEWVMARYGQVIPVNWSSVQMIQFLSSYVPLGYEVSDAQNLICSTVVNNDFEWLLLVEHDTCPPVDGFIKFNRYMREGKYPIVSALYYSRSRPSEPLVFRGRGNSVYNDWEESPGKAKEGQELVWCDGVPTGMLLVSGRLIKAMWDDSPEYAVGNAITRRVFETPRTQWLDPEMGVFNSAQGTSDLNWCDRIIREGYIEKAGYEVPDPENPFLVDTTIFCQHIDIDGQVYP